MSFRLEAACLTDAGTVRADNEDHLLVVPERRLFGVFDGVGGHRAGEVASAMAAQCVRDAVDGGATLVEALHAAHRQVQAAGRNDPVRAGMASTAVAVRLHYRFFRYAWVGDSRLYRLDPRRGCVECLTRDHSFVQQQVDAGVLSQEEAQTHPMASLLSQSIGLSRSGRVVPGEGRGWLRRGQWLLLCSDGLSAYVPSNRYLQLAVTAATPAALAEALVAAANAAGGHDNVSVVVIAG